MKQRKKYISVLCAIAVMVLCSVNMTYAWQNLNQTALNINMGERAQNKPGGDDTDDPGSTGKPDSPDKPDKPENPDKPDNPDDPENPDNPDKPGNAGKPGQPGTEDPSGASGTANGTGETKTGDTAEFLGYLILMFVSFAVIIVAGAMLIVLLIHEIERRRK